MLTWGKALTDWAISQQNNPLDDFLSGRQVLLQVSLPTNSHLPEGVDHITVDRAGNRNTAQQAKLISAAPQIDTTTAGESYFFSTQGNQLKPGMRLVAWITDPSAGDVGVIIPKSALIWHFDQALAYVKTGHEQFERRHIEQFSTTPDGYFTRTVLKPGDLVVTQGAQMLLSAELQGISQEADD